LEEEEEEEEEGKVAGLDKEGDVECRDATVE
jgi:hypothetical protein